jgi:hypothetical protein
MLPSRQNAAEKWPKLACEFFHDKAFFPVFRARNPV